MKEGEMANQERGVLFGIDYYPEQWDKSLWKEDARRMALMGLRAARMMESAWGVIEPEEGRFDFSLFDEMIELFAHHDIRTVLGTPTATFPAWLAQKQPSVFQVHPSGVTRDFGTRRAGCYNSEIYTEASRKVVKAAARHFGDNPHVIGWQVDNEIGHEGSDRCICPACQKKWRRWLRDKYKEIGSLNRTWGTAFWSTQYSDFDQVPVPRKQTVTQQNPGLLLDYDRFCSDSAVRFLHSQVEVLRKHISPVQWLSTNLYLTPHSAVIDMEEVFTKLDEAGTSDYPVWGDMDEPNPYYFMDYFLSYSRGVKARGLYTVFEQFTNVQGHAGLGYLPPIPQVVLWTNQAIARGANRVFYFRWRTAPVGQEQLCYGILDRDDQVTARYEALAANIRKNQVDFEKFANQPVESAACVIYDKDNSRIVREQYLSKGFYVVPTPYIQVGYDVEVAHAFAPYVLFNVNADVCCARSADLGRYKVISLPVYQMADPEFVDRLAKWVEGGGYLILSWRAGTRDLNNQSVSSVLPGCFTEMAGVKIRDFESLNNRKVGIRIGIIPSQGEVWADLLEPFTARALAWYQDRKKHYSGMPCVTVNKFGQGRVYYLATRLGPTAIFLLYRSILKDARIGAHFYGVGIEVVHRRCEDGSFCDVILNHTSRAKRVRGKRIPAYGMAVLPVAKG